MRYEQVNLNDHWVNVPGWSGWRMRFEFSLQVQINDNAHFLEIGAWKGQTSCLMAQLIKEKNKNIKFDVIDTWLGSQEDEHLNDIDLKNNRLYEVFLEYTEPFKEYINPIRSTSVDASLLYQDNSIDFIFLDASHTTEDVTDDIKAWLPKIKEGGIIAGDDLDFPSVKLALDNSEIADLYEEVDSKYGPYWRYEK